MLVAHGHEVRCDDVVISLFHSRRGEGARDEKSRGRFGGFGRLVGMQRSAIILWWSELVSDHGLDLFREVG